ncbi:MAG: coproporphyrinogen-III oxidase family protein [Candidatus Omnitrophota bacterium]
MKILTRTVRKLLSDKTDRFTFDRCAESDYVLNPKKAFGLYLHIPFCRSLCPYCPYNKILYDRSTAESYVEAVCKEIELAARRIGRQKFESLYIGGGTPTLLIPGLEKIMTEIRKYFVVNGPIAIETTPSDFTEDKIKKLKEIGVTYISLGVQSFEQKNLALLGRNHDSAATEQAAFLLNKKDFEVANVDLIFAYPGQTVDELLGDLQRCVSFGPQQVTCYPLFTFPYSNVGQFFKLKNVRMPGWFIRRKMYYAIVDFFKQRGYGQSSVWSFNLNQNGKYSSVTRDYYIGFGAGAASYTGTDFYFNTFSVPEYLRTARQRIPVALKMQVSPRLERLFWLYWRFYDTQIPTADYRRLFGRTLDQDFGGLLSVLKILGFLAPAHDNSLYLTKRGSFWVHLLQNHFALNYVNTLWTACRLQSWPSRIAI